MKLRTKKPPSFVQIGQPRNLVGGLSVELIIYREESKPLRIGFGNRCWVIKNGYGELCSLGLYFGLDV